MPLFVRADPRSLQRRTPDVPFDDYAWKDADEISFMKTDRLEFIRSWKIHRASAAMNIPRPLSGKQGAVLDLL